MFISFLLTDAETRYSNTERECLAIIRSLAEVQWLVVRSKSSVLLYTDHNALLSILTKGSEGHGRVTAWQDQLGEYDYVVHHQPAKDPMMAIADGLSQLLKQLSTIPKAFDTERILMLTLPSIPYGWKKGDDGRLGPNLLKPANWTKMSKLRDQIELESGYERYNGTVIFGDVVTYLRFSCEALGDMGQPELKALLH